MGKYVWGEPDLTVAKPKKTLEVNPCLLSVGHTLPLTLLTEKAGSMGGISS